MGKASFFSSTSANPLQYSLGMPLQMFQYRYFSYLLLVTIVLIDTGFALVEEQLGKGMTRVTVASKKEKSMWEVGY